MTCAVFKGTQIKWQDQQIIPLNHILVQFVERYFLEHNAKTHERKKEKKHDFFIIQAYKEVLI